MHHSYLRIAASAPALLFAIAAPALAQTAPVSGPIADAPPADRVIIVGQSEAPITVAPRGLSVSLGEAQFDAVNAVNVEDLMKYAPNFFIRKRYIGDANGVPGFRGTHSSQSARSLVMVDGFVISNLLGNSFGFPPKWGVVGPGEAGQFDIVYGPYSSRYSGNSIGGVISITTKAPQNDEAFATAQYFVQPYEQYATSDTFDGLTLEAGAGWRPNDGPFAVRASFRHFENVGQPMSWYQFEAPTGAAAQSVTGAVVDPGLIVKRPIIAAESPDENVQDQLRLRADLDLGAWTLQGVGVYWTTGSDRTRPQIYLRDASGQPVTSRANVSFNGATYRPAAVPWAVSERTEILTGLKASGPLLGWDARINLSRFWQDKDEGRQSNDFDAGRLNGAGRLTRMGEPNWVTLDATFEQSIADHAIAFGASTNRYETATDIFSTTNWRTDAGAVRTNHTEGVTQQLGVFIEDEITLSDTVEVTAGVRFDQWKAHGGRVGALATTAPTPRPFVTQAFPSRQDGEFSYSLSGQWAFATDWQAQLSLANSTRFPTVGELFQGGLNSDGSFNVNSFDPNLRPETSRDANLMLRHGLKAFGGDLRLTGSLFWQEVRDALFRQQGFNQFGVVTNSNQNIGKVRQVGVEAIAETKDAFASGLDMDLNLAFIDSEIVENDALPASVGKQFPRIPYWRANGSIRYGFAPGWRAALGFRFNTRPSSDLEGLQKGDTFGYASEQLITDVKLTWDASRNAEVSFGIDNLNNDKAWAFHPFPQRTFVIEAKVKQ